eukprot:PITA_09258
MPLNPQMTLQPFHKWAIDFVGPIKPQGKTGARYIIIMREYLTQWVEAQPVKDCMAAMAAKFLFENMLTRFGCPKFLMSDCKTHFLNETISALTKEFQRNNWDLLVPVVLWAYGTTCKKLTGQTTFWLVYGMEVVIPMEYIIPSLRIAVLTGMTDREALEERLAQLEELEEERFLAGFHQKVQKQREKSWYNHHIKVCTFKVNDLVLLYDSKFENFPGKFRMHSLGPYVVKEVTDGGAV